MTDTAPFSGFYKVDLFDCPPFQMFTADDCAASQYILGEKRFEPMSMRIWCALARTATGIIDIGANVGIYSLAAASLRNDIPIHAFEPNPYAFARLRVHKVINAFANLAEYTVALAESSRVDRLSWARKAHRRISSGGTLARQNYDDCETFPCDVRRLDDYDIAVGPYGLVKIDVEGAEQPVTLGMKKVLAERPDIIIEAFDPEVCRLVFKRLAPQGYRAFAIDEDAMTLTRLETFTPADKASGSFNRLLSVRDDPLAPR